MLYACSFLVCFFCMYVFSVYTSFHVYVPPSVYPSVYTSFCVYVALYICSSLCISSPCICSIRAYIFLTVKLTLTLCGFHHTVCIVRILSCGFHYLDSIMRIPSCRFYYAHFKVRILLWDYGVGLYCKIAFCGLHYETYRLHHADCIMRIPLCRFYHANSILQIILCAF